MAIAAAWAKLPPEPIATTSSSGSSTSPFEEKTPKQIVELLDKYIIGQNEAKKSVAVALYNRYRRLQLPKQMQQDITPKNMLMDDLQA